MWFYTHKIDPVLNEEFADANLPAMDWALVSTHKELTEDQMRKYARQLSWPLIARHQHISREFAAEMVNYIDLDVLGAHQPHLSIADMFRLHLKQTA